MKKYPLWLVAIGVALYGLAWGGGGSEVGNSGNVLRLKDDTVVLGDPYMKRDGTEFSQNYDHFKPELQDEIERVGLILTRLGAALDDTKPPYLPKELMKTWTTLGVPARYLARNESARFLKDFVKNEYIEYRLVDRLPAGCGSAGPAGTAPEDCGLQSIACTVGPVTWIRSDLFRKMSIREATKMLIHERLHSLQTSKLPPLGIFPHEYIADMTDGLEVMLDHFSRQIAGKRERLSADELAKASKMMERMWSVGLESGRLEAVGEFTHEWALHPNGGGLVHKGARVSPDAFVGVASMIGDGSSLAADSVVLNSTCYLSACDLAPRSKLLHSALAPSPVAEFDGSDPRLPSKNLKLELEEGAEMSNTTWGARAGQGGILHLGSGAVLRKSAFYGFWQITLGARASLSNSQVAVLGGESHLELGRASSLAGLVAGGPWTVHPRSDMGPLPGFTVSAGAALDFKGEPICPAGKEFRIDSEVNFEQSDLRTAHCRTIGAP